MSSNPSGADNASGTIGIWGPSTDRQKTAKDRDASQGSPSLTKTPHNGKNPSGTNVSNSRPTSKRSWGLVDVVVGMLAFLGSHAVLAGGLIFWTVYGSVSEGASVEDTDALVDQSLEWATSGWFLFASAILMYASWMFAMRRATYKKGLKSFAKDFWLKFNWKRDIPLGLAFAVVLRGLEWLVTTVLVQVGVDMSTGGNTDTIINQPGIWYFVNAIIVAAFLAPFFEELFFRGLFLQGALRNFRGGRFTVPQTIFGRAVNDHVPGLFSGYVAFRHFLYKNRNWLAVALSSMVFGLMHFQGTETFAQLFVVLQTGVIGVMLALIVLKTKRLGLAIWGHIFFNLSGVLLATFIGS